MDQLFESMSSLSQFDMSKIFKMNDYSADTQNHLFQVYLSLMLCVLAASGGAATTLFLHLDMNLGLIGSFGAMGMLMWINYDSNKQDIKRRMGLLCVFGFLNGMSLSPLISQAIYIDPALIVTAFLGTVTVFACFTGAAVVAKRRQYLYLGGLLASALSLMCVLSIMNIFFRSVNIYFVNLYGGLLMFSGYVVFDTQVILEKAEMGNRDVVGHAATLFIDFVAIFVRILIILMKNNKGNNDRNKKNRNRSGEL